MAAAVAGEVLGPRPGKAICSFWQGNVEIDLRFAVIAVSVQVYFILHVCNKLYMFHDVYILSVCIKQLYR